MQRAQNIQEAATRDKLLTALTALNTPEFEQRLARKPESEWTLEEQALHEIKKADLQGVKMMRQNQLNHGFYDRTEAKERHQERQKLKQWEHSVKIDSIKPVKTHDLAKSPKPPIVTEEVLQERMKMKKLQEDFDRVT